MASLQDPHVSLGHVQSLQKLCLRAIGRQLHYFCNLRLRPEVAQNLSETEKQLIYIYDLSRLDVFEAQTFLSAIDKWCTLTKRTKRGRKRLIKREVDDTFLRYVLLPPTEKTILDYRFRRFEFDLGLVASPYTKDDEEGDKDEDPVAAAAGGADGDGIDEADVSPAISSKVASRDNVVCYRLSVASVGCGLIAHYLQSSSPLVKLRLNNCQIADAGAILLASGIRLTTRLRLLDLSNEDSAYRGEMSMDNKIGDTGTQAIALALEKNQSVEQVDLSGNPVGSIGAIGLTSMLKKNTNLQQLRLDRTLVQDCTEALIDAFEASKSGVDCGQDLVPSWFPSKRLKVSMNVPSDVIVLRSQDQVSAGTNILQQPA